MYSKFLINASHSWLSSLAPAGLYCLCGLSLSNYASDSGHMFLRSLRSLRGQSGEGQWREKPIQSND